MGRGYIYPVRKQKRVSVNVHKLSGFKLFYHAHMEGTVIGFENKNKLLVYLDNMQKAYTITIDRISPIRDFENIEWKPKDNVEIKQEVTGVPNEYNWWNANIIKRIDNNTYRIRWKQQYILDDGSIEPIECNVNKNKIRSSL